LYDAHGIFLAKAWILQEPGVELEPYLDVPAFDRGDLFFLQKLIVTLENYSVPGNNPQFYLPMIIKND